MPKPTPSQTVGPFFARELLWKDGGIVLFRKIDIPTDLPAALTFQLDQPVLVVGLTTMTW